MGKAIVIPDISFSASNLGQVTFINNSIGLKITALENLTISFSNDLKCNIRKYPEWQTYKADTELHISAGNSVIFKGSLKPTQAGGIGTFTISGDFNVSGNILALINNDICANAFKHLFQNCTDLIDASGLILPEDTAESCYEGMFKGCTGLEAAPNLKATTLTANCYKEMFYGCSSLDIINIYSETPIGEDYTLNWVNGVAASGTFNKIPYIIYSVTGNNGIPSGWDVDTFHELEYFTVESLTDNNTISMVKGPIAANISYSLNSGETWTDITLSSGTTNFGTINTGDTIVFKGNNIRLATAWDNYNHFNGSGNYKVYGNVMSLLYEDEFLNNSEFDSSVDNHLAGLFKGSTTLIDASNLILPALTLYYNSYNGMFRECTNLTAGPQLPATQAGQECYGSMFEACINLEVAPEINFVSLAQSCCKRMFCMDRSLKLTTPKMTKSPILRVATPVQNCYEEMFKGNGNLNEITCLITTSNIQCTSNWVTNVGNGTGVFKKSPLKSDWTYGTNSAVPVNWTIEDYVEN